MVKFGEQMVVIQCFNCENWADEAATQIVETVSAEAVSSPPIKRAWCGSCLAQIQANTNQALTDMPMDVSTEWISKE